MRLLGILLALTGAALAAPAQTNTNAPQVNTNALPVSTNAPQVRKLSLEDCILLTLQTNLDLQIDRFGPRLQLYTLNGAYGAYDPGFTFSGKHSHSENGSLQITTNTVFVSSTVDQDQFSAGLGGANGGSGLLPWGLNYSLSSSLSDTHSSYSPLPNAGGSASFTLTQPLLKNSWMDSARMNIRVAKNRLKYSELLLRLQIMQTLTSLEQAYYDLIYARENVIVQEKAVELAMQLVKENKKRVDVGTLAPLDFKQAEAQAASSQAVLIAARSTLAVQEHTIKQFITDRYSAWDQVGIEPAGSLTASRPFLNLHDSWTKGLTQRPDFLQAKLDIEKAGIQLKFARNQLFPELDVSGSYGYNGAGLVYSGALYDIQQQNHPFYYFGGQITIPLGNITARNNYKYQKATLEQVLLTLKQLERNIMVQIDNDLKQAQSGFEQVGATRAASQYAADALDAEQKKLDNGKSTTYTVLQMQRDLTTARGNEIQALDTYNKTLSQLSYDEGSTLERLNINFEVVK